VVSKIIVCILTITIISCFYLQSKEIIDLENKIETIESNSKEVNKMLYEFNEIFLLLIEEMDKHTHHTHTYM